MQVEQIVDTYRRFYQILRSEGKAIEVMEQLQHMYEDLRLVEQERIFKVRALTDSLRYMQQCLEVLQKHPDPCCATKTLIATIQQNIENVNAEIQQLEDIANVPTRVSTEADADGFMNIIQDLP